MKPTLSIPALLLILPGSVLMAEPVVDLTDISYDGGALPDGQTAITAAVQILLDRAGVSPSVIDGYAGGMSTSAISGFELREGLPVDGEMDQDVWDRLGGPDADAYLQDYTITADDMDVRGSPLPDDYSDLAELDALPFTSVAEAIAEQFHMDQEFLEGMNLAAVFVEGETIVVVDPGEDKSGEVARIEIRKADQRLVAFDEDDDIISNYPVAVGSDQTPSPEGTVEVEAVAVGPTYTYQPDVNFQQGENNEVLTLPPGPNGPVGLVWIDLSKPTYGIHGTPEPASLFSAASHGCVRMTNWDVMELAEMTGQGVTVEFVE